MELKSNKYFLNNDFDIEEREEIDLYDTEEKANVIVWGYNELVNNLKILPTITEEDIDNIVYNCYVEFDKKGNFWFVISFYDYDKRFLSKEMIKKLEEINFEIKVEINTEEEKDLFNKKLNEFMQVWNIKSIEEIFNF